MKGTPEQIVGSLAERTPDSQSVMNVHHMQILKGELSGQLNLDTVMLRPLVASGKVVELSNSKGMLFHPSEEEEAIQRWTRYDSLGLERQFAKRSNWRTQCGLAPNCSRAYRETGSVSPSDQRSSICLDGLRNK